MSRYDFIRFGGFVNWADGDTFRKMKVCLPVKEPVEDDTKIGLISTDEDNPEEIAVSYSVRAAELIPWTDSFQEGYWKALIVAEANGAGTDVLLPMLKDAESYKIISAHLSLLFIVIYLTILPVLHR